MTSVTDPAYVCYLTRNSAGIFFFFFFFTHHFENLRVHAAHLETKPLQSKRHCQWSFNWNCPSSWHTSESLDWTLVHLNSDCMGLNYTATLNSANKQKQLPFKGKLKRRITRVTTSLAVWASPYSKSQMKWDFVLYIYAECYFYYVGREACTQSDKWEVRVGRASNGIPLSPSHAPFHRTLILR